MNLNKGAFPGLQLLTVDDVVQLHGLSRDTVHRLETSGELPGRKIARSWRFPSDAVEAFVRQETRTSTKARRRR